MGLIYRDRTEGKVALVTLIEDAHARFQP